MRVLIRNEMFLCECWTLFILSLETNWETTHLGHQVELEWRLKDSHTHITLVDANLNRHALRPNKQYWNNCPRKLKFKFWLNPDSMFISETRTKSISNKPWPNDYNWNTNQMYKVWTPQGRISDKFTVLEEPKEKQSLTFSDFYSIIS